VVSRNFTEIFQQRIEELIPGDPMNESTLIGPLSSIKQAEIVESQVRKSVEMGAELITGGERTGAFFKPALVIGVKPGMPLFEEEVFGPVAPVIIADNTDEAINLANKTRYGLGVTIFTRDIMKAKKMVPRFDEGAVFINSLVKSDPRLPFGGTKQSGYGRELSLHGIREFVNIKTVYIKE
jgi:succinate-semialdehyde dehydrogenase/glutarate-semialdehyde dehydrogenase